MNDGMLHKLFGQMAQHNKQPWLQTYRNESWKAFHSLGLPNRSWEDWRYISLQPLKELIGRDSALVGKLQYLNSKDQYFSAKLEDLKDKSHELVSSARPINGHYLTIFGINGIFERPHHKVPNFLFSTLDELPETPFLLFNQIDKSLSKTSLSVGQKDLKSPFLFLNNALMSDAAILRVKKQSPQENNNLTIHVVNGVSSERSPLVFPRLVILLENGSRVSIIESYLSLDDKNDYFCAPVTQIFLSEESHLNHVRIQNDDVSGIHLATTQKILQSKSIVNSLSLSGSGKVVRHNLEIRLEGPHSQAEFNGLFLGKSNQVVDHHTLVDHAHPLTTSKQLYHGMISDQSRGIFNGKVIVRPGAHGTDAKQTNKNLLLSSDAEIDTKPELQIEADDVKCSHGAAIGQVDQNQMQYLLSRGIPMDYAKKMLLGAFASSVIERFPLDIKPLKKWTLDQVGRYFV